MSRLPKHIRILPFIRSQMIGVKNWFVPLLGHDHVVWHSLQHPLGTEDGRVHKTHYPKEGALISDVSKHTLFQDPIFYDAAARMAMGFSPIMGGKQRSITIEFEVGALESLGSRPHTYKLCFTNRFVFCASFPLSHMPKAKGAPDNTFVVNMYPLSYPQTHHHKIGLIASAEHHLKGLMGISQTPGMRADLLPPVLENKT
jgi:hypothetical protein